MHTRWFLAVLLISAGSLALHASETKVGDTKDGCSGDNAVTFQTASGTAKVKANTSPAPFDLPGLTTEITWYCGGSRERSANDTAFNRLKISRAKNGAIQWTFYKVTSTSTSADPDVEMGNSKDACDASHTVTFTAKDGTVKLAAGQSAFKELPALTRELSWTCGASDERVANPNAFDFVEVERAGNGAIQWYFYRGLSVTDDSTGNYLDMVPGDVVLQAPSLGLTLPLPGLFKAQFDTFWDANLKDIEKEVLKSLKGDKRYTISSLTLSPSSQAELRVGENKDSVLVKYVVHQNTAEVTKTATFQAVFDVELVMFLPQSQVLPLQASRGTAFVHHFELHASGAGDYFLAAFAKSRIHAVETSSNSITQDVKDRVNKALAQASKQIPAPAGTPMTLTASQGTIEGCIKIKPGDVCRFDVSPPAAITRKTLDTSHDQCGENKIWIWDYQRGQFVPVSKGGSALIEVDNQRFEWFCGGDSEPNSKNAEWATGPEGTYFVGVKRDPSSRQIDWTFEFWK